MECRLPCSLLKSCLCFWPSFHTYLYFTPFYRVFSYTALRSGVELQVDSGVYRLSGGSSAQLLGEHETWWMLLQRLTWRFYQTWRWSLSGFVLHSDSINISLGHFWRARFHLRTLTMWSAPAVCTVCILFGKFSKDFLNFKPKMRLLWWKYCESVLSLCFTQNPTLVVFNQNSARFTKRNIFFFAKVQVLAVFSAEKKLDVRITAKVWKPKPPKMKYCKL